jgi:uncharacterized membrane protein
MKKTNTLFIVQFGILLAIEAIICFTPLGSLPALGPIVMTLMMIPVIITALLLGAKAGTLMGFFAGLFSCTVWSFMTPVLSAPIAFVFTPIYSYGELSGNFGSVLICFIPRILSGTVAGLAFNALSVAKPKNNILNLSLASAFGSLVNTFGVVGGIWLFFGKPYSMIAGEAMYILAGLTILTSGIPEAVLSAVVCPAICRPLQIITGKDKKST